MPSTYQLQPDEWVISKSAAGVFHGARLKPEIGHTELVLTNRNLIVVSLGIWGKAKSVRYFPLEQVAVIDGRPQVHATGGYGRYMLDIRFQHGQESFGFNSKAQLHAWADSIFKLMTGRSDEISVTTDLSTNGTGSIRDQLKDTVDLFKATFGLDSGEDRAGIPTPSPDRAAGKCTSCSAPIAGIAGRVARCEYCQSDQQL